MDDRPIDFIRFVLSQTLNGLAAGNYEQSSVPLLYKYPAVGSIRHRQTDTETEHTDFVSSFLVSFLIQLYKLIPYNDYTGMLSNLYIFMPFKAKHYTNILLYFSATVLGVWWAQNKFQSQSLNAESNLIVRVTEKLDKI